MAVDDGHPRAKGAATRHAANIAWSMMTVVCWAAVTLIGIALAATVTGRTLTPLHAVFQMALPYVIIVLAVPLLVAALTRRRALTVVTGILVLATAALLAPAVVPDAAPAASPEDVSVFVANIRYDNDTPVAKQDQILGRDEDVIVLIELTPNFLVALDARGFEERYPYRIAAPRHGAHGAGIFSSRPLVDARAEAIGELNAPAATIDTPAGPLRVVAIHTRPPVADKYLPVWSDDLLAIERHAAALKGPTVLAGDFNATRWHPGFTSILGQGLHDAHEQQGEGLSFSWPDGGRLGALVPPFSRLDHALLHQSEATAVEDLPGAGSDHLAFTVRVRPRAPVP